MAERIRASGASVLANAPHSGSQAKTVIAWIWLDAVAKTHASSQLIGVRTVGPEANDVLQLNAAPGRIGEDQLAFVVGTAPALLSDL